MEISGEFINIGEKHLANILPGEYLYIEKNRGETKAYIPFEIFSGLYTEAKRGISLSTPEPRVGVSANMPAEQEQGVEPYFKKLMNYLAEEIKISEDDFDSNKNELLVQSDFGTFLELPWEEITNKEIFVFRRVVSEKKNELEKSVNNLMFVMSNANLSYDGKLENLKKKLKEEILGIYELIDQSIENEPKYFKIDNIHISKHTTKDSFRSLPWSQYNYVHFIMHGKEDGGLCLEQPEIENYKHEDVINMEDIIDVLKNENIFLLFLSFCYSGGGLNNGNCLSFYAAMKGIAKYIIGYRYPVGDISASTFAKSFYTTLLSNLEGDKSDRIERIYKRSLSDYYKNPQQKNGYIPLLYING